MRVLVADDDPVLVLLAKATLERSGHQVATANNGKQVLELAKESPPDIILLDVMMPELDGFSTLTAIRANELLKETPVIMLSARVSQEDRRRGLESGANDYLTKPFDPDTLAATVADLGAMSINSRTERQQERIAALSADERHRVHQPIPATPTEQTTLFSVLDLAVDAIVSIDASQYIVAFNKGAESVFGYIAEEVLGKPLDVLLPDRFSSVHSRHVERFATSNDTARLMGERQEIFGRRKDGTEFPAEASIAKVEVDGRQILTAILRDVTKQRETERVLRTRAHQQAAVAELGQLALSGVQSEQLFDDACRLVVEVLEADLATVIDLKGRVSSFVSPITWPESLPNSEFPNARTSLIDFTLNNPGAIVIDDLMSESRFDVPNALIEHDLHGGMTAAIGGLEVPFGVLGVFSTQQRSFDTDDTLFLQSIANTLAGAINRERTEERLRIFLESAPDATIVVNPEGKIVSINEQAEELFGYSRSELLDLPVDALVPDNIRSQHAAYRKEFDKEPRTRPMGAGLNLQALRKDGSEVPVDILLRPLEMNGSRLVVAAIRDVTDRRRSEQIRDAFLHAVSHDLRTPLTGVVGFSTLLRKPEVLQSPETVAEYANLIFDGAKKLETLLGDLLDLDRLARGVIQPQRRQTDLEALVRSVAATLPLESNRLTIELEPDAVVVSVDPAQVERIIENLLINVTRHCPKGTAIWVKSRRGPNGILLSVEDSGPGVPDELKEAIFDPFRRGDHEAASPGSGIGLSLVARFAELHGGRVWIDDRPGGGAAFRVLLREAQSRS